MLTVHLGCAALVGADLLARSMRLRWLTAGVGHGISVGAALRTNLCADAGATLSPMRLAGEPARIAAMRLAGVPMPTALAAIAWELVTAWPTLLLMATLIVATCAPKWWDASAPALAPAMMGATPIIAVIACLAVVSILAARHFRTRLPMAVVEPLALLRRSWRTMPPWPVIASVPLSAINIAARTALLPVLALTLPDPPPAAALWLGSFLLVYGQLAFPTPAGAGAVELGFLGGAAGDLGEGVGLLVAWRWWANGATALLGVAVALRIRRRSGGWS